MRRFAYVTDLHLNEAFPVQHHVDAERNWQRVLADIKQEKITSLIIGGDIGEASSHPWFFDTLKEFSFELTLGNHDNYNEIKKHVSLANSGCGELYYSVEQGINKFLFLDSSSGNLSLQQVQWMTDKLATEKKVVLFIHHPVLEVTTRVDKLFPLQNRNDVLTQLADSEREITIFCGHYHLVDEQCKDRIRQVVSPAVSFQMLKSAEQLLIDSSQFGYRVISLHDDGDIETSVKMFQNESPEAGITVVE